MTRRRRRPQGGRGGAWLQASCSLFPGAGGAPFVPWSELAATVTGWRTQGLFDHWSYVLKPPGLRLRFTGSRAAELQAELAGWLLAAEDANAIRGFRFTVYEPEEHRFGGAAGMDVAHAHFDADSDCALRLNADADATAAVRVDHSFRVMGDLMGRVVDDPAEVWDVWMRLRDAVRLAGAGVGDVKSVGAPTEGGHPATAAAIASNGEVAGKLRALADAGALSTGVRSWLVAVTVFHWNRLGLTTTELAPALERTISAIDR